MQYGYETYKAQANIYQAKGAESRLGEDYASNQQGVEDNHTVSLFSRIRAWFQHLVAADQPADIEAQYPADQPSWVEELLHPRKSISVGE